MEENEMTRRHQVPSNTEIEAAGTPAAELAPAEALEPKAEIEPVDTSEPVASGEGDEAESGSQSTVGAIAESIASHIAGVADLIARRVSPRPLTNLYELHPEARDSSPREIGFRFVDLEDIRGTAVAGPAQRGEDFLPLARFRGENWASRWRRIKEANERLRPLPPIDVVKYDGGFWVVDGHNRVAAARADNAVGLDAMVTELVPLDGQSSELPSVLLPYLPEMSELRAAVAGSRPAIDIRRGRQLRAGLASGGVKRNVPLEPGDRRPGDSGGGRVKRGGAA